MKGPGLAIVLTVVALGCGGSPKSTSDVALVMPDTGFDPGADVTKDTDGTTLDTPVHDGPRDDVLPDPQDTTAGDSALDTALRDSVGEGLAPDSHDATTGDEVPGIHEIPEDRPEPTDEHPGDVDLLRPDGIAADEGPDIGPVDPPCVRATACGSGATCNLCSGKCEARSPGWGSGSEVLSAYPSQGAPGDFIVVDGAGFGLLTSATIGGVGASSEKDENRLVVTRPQGATGTLTVGGMGGSASFDVPIETSSDFEGLQTCRPGDPPATGRIPMDPAEIGPWAVGFTDYNKSFYKVRVFYPATCGGLRRPPASGQFPFVMFMHGDGCVALNYEYLARHLASWGFLAAIPDNGDWSVLEKGRESPEDWFAPLAGMATRSDAAVVCHSMGAQRTSELVLSDVRAVVFLGPVYTGESPYGQSMFPLQGLVIGGSEDGRPTTDKCSDVYEQLENPRYMVMVKRGNHSQFTDDKLWDTPSDGSGAFVARNRQHELVQSFTLAYLQRVFGQAESFPGWLTGPGLANEIQFFSDP